MKKDEGGSAFPIQEIPGISTGANGMTLRDYFAAHENSVPTQEWVLKFNGRLVGGRVSAEELAAAVAAWRYLMADAMIAERGKV